MKKVMFIIVFVFLFSCQKEKTNPYVGNWYFDKIVDYDSTKTNSSKQMLEIYYGSLYNFNIINDSVLDFKNGFIYRINGNLGNSTFHSNYYLGSKTNYKINKSDLLFFNKSEKEWDTLRIKKISNDTMIVLGKEKCNYRLIRKQNNYFNNSYYDAITIYNSYCYGSCPENSTYINRKGEFYFRGFDFNTEYGIFYSNLYTNQINEIFNEFDKIDFPKLKSRYGGISSDAPTNIISFFKNGKVVKTIECYQNTPIDLEKEYLALSYFYQQVKLNKDENSMLYNNIWHRSFNSQNRHYDLKESESFFLEVALRNGKKGEFKFHPNYNINFSDLYGEGDIKSIITDGRYYKFTKKDNTSFTIDIGYNFVDLNPIIKKNRDY